MGFDPNRFDQRDGELIRGLAEVVDTVGAYYHRTEIGGTERIPEGPALYVGNHNGGLLSIDTFLAFARVVLERGVEHAPFGLTHSVIVRFPGLNQILVPLGAVEASRENAERAFERGYKVLVYPGGDIEALRPYRERNLVKFGGRRGWIRLALRTGVPIVPLAAAGAHRTMYILDDGAWLARELGLDELLRVKVWPVMLSIPWGLTVGPSPPYIPFPVKIAIEFLEPIEFDRTGPEAASDDAYVDACAYRVESHIQAAVDRMVDQKL